MEQDKALPIARKMETEKHIERSVKRKIVWRFLKKCPCDLVIPFLGVHPKELNTGIQTDTCTLMFIATFFTVAQKEKNPSVLQPLECT